MLNLNQSPQELANLYADQNYYWYLSSYQWHRDLLEPLGQIINGLGSSCLDVGCGEGQLADHVTLKYVGFDGSQTAINKGKEERLEVDLRLGRLEDPPKLDWFDVVVFSGILEVLVKPSERVNLLNMYQELYLCNYFVIVDLERFDPGYIGTTYQLLQESHFEIKDIEIIQVKRFRKVLVYKC